MWTKQKVKFLELRKIIIYWLLRHLSIFHYYFTQAKYPWIFQFPHFFIQKSKYIHYDLRIFFTHFNAVKRPQNFSKILPCHHHNTNNMQIIILSKLQKPSKYLPFFVQSNQRITQYRIKNFGTFFCQNDSIFFCIHCWGDFPPWVIEIVE